MKGLLIRGITGLEVVQTEIKASTTDLHDFIWKT